MDKELDRYFDTAVESFDLGQEKRRLVNKLEDIMLYEYKFPLDSDSIRRFVDAIVKKVAEYYSSKIMEYKEKIAHAFTYAITNDRPNAIVVAIDDVPTINSEHVVMGIYEATLYATFRRYAMQSRIYEDLPRQVKYQLSRFVDDIQEVISLNLKLIKNHVEQMGADMFRMQKSEDHFEKSERPSPTEIIGINYDDGKNCFWTEVKGKKVKVDLSQDRAMIDEAHYVEVRRSPNGNDMRITIFENGQELKSLFVMESSITYSTRDMSVTNNLKNNTLIISKGFDSEEYDLDNLSFQDRRTLDGKLKEVDESVYGYYNRALPKKSIESLFL